MVGSNLSVLSRLGVVLVGKFFLRGTQAGEGGLASIENLGALVQLRFPKEIAVLFLMIVVNLAVHFYFFSGSF